MTLSEFIRAQIQTLSNDWEQFAKTYLPAAKDLSSAELRNHTVDLLHAVALDMDSTQSITAQHEKSQGRLPKNAPDLTSFSIKHAQVRVDQGFTVDQLAAEFCAVRASVLKHWVDTSSSMNVLDIIRFNEAIDQSWFESSKHFAYLIEHSRQLFLGMIGHDLRAPLNTIAMSASILETFDNQDVQRVTQRVARSSARMGVMIEDLVDFVRVGLGARLPITTAHVDLNQLVTETVEDIKAANPAAYLKWQAAMPVLGQWDTGRLRQLATNLIGNAIHHGDSAKPIIIAVRLDQGDAVLTVHNYGNPIPPELIGSIFDPLKRGTTDGTTRQFQEGLGLGLYISRQIAVVHGGSLTVMSTPKGGTTFTARFPCIVQSV